ncbi:TlpA disulfide reductase family protein [Parasegetibacter sp. NRK P23]|uniref:TlpA disulfide reductase family protein n=1 Tax=Parasegetibacter sp. NRK P23 TaxID=2942999 RepID=UPI002043BB50|nr:TlpA disulfide reductase family protein [Parasegetibacter sp. NRK P23]MCM5529094.1 TlpA family protein disulfide reductase [Parasegetibacter sp. NRK P23]
MKKLMAAAGWLLYAMPFAHAQNGAGKMNDFGMLKAGDTFQVAYKPEDGPLKGSDSIDAVVYMYNNYRWELSDLPLRKTDTAWIGQLKLPEQCAFVGLKFVQWNNGELVASDNNNDRGFVTTTVSKDGGRVPGAALSWALFRKPSLHMAPSGYFEKFEISNEALELWVRKEMQYFPDSMHRYFDSYIAMLKHKEDYDFQNNVERNLLKFANNPHIDESGYAIIADTYRMLKMNDKADSVRKRIITLFPSGNAARFDRSRAVGASKSIAEMITAMEGFLRDFPIKDYLRQPVRNQDLLYFNAYRTLASAYFNQEQNEKIFTLVPDMNFATLNEVFRSNLDAAFTVGKISAEKAYSLSKVLINEMINKQKDGSYMEQTRYSPLQSDMIALKHLDDKLGIHIRVLEKLGKYKEALSYMARLSAEGKYRSVLALEAQVNILEKTGNKKGAQELLENSVRKNMASPVMLAQLKKYYAAKKGSEKGFDAYVQALKPAAAMKAMKEKIRAELINEPGPVFELEAMNGGTVKTADWKDKIVVLDFWATWCYPCKAAFPGMQMVVDKYANDKSVAFYFIATMEPNPAFRDNIRKYIAETGYRFNVLFDTNLKLGQADNIAYNSMRHIFQSSGIPRKVVLKNGVIRYTSEGYNGSPSELADEISAVIEILKSEQ